MKIRNWLMVVSLAAVAVFAFAACDDKSGGSESVADEITAELSDDDQDEIADALAEEGSEAGEAAEAASDVADPAAAIIGTWVESDDIDEWTFNEDGTCLQVMLGREFPDVWEIQGSTLVIGSGDSIQSYELRFDGSDKAIWAYEAQEVAGAEIPAGEYVYVRK
ncbi:MAG: cytochrome P450 [Clostridiales Family XIII bacterium]|nr:cytochrome P450 [Clostridiales Family XIII bacterium]